MLDQEQADQVKGMLLSPGWEIVSKEYANELTAARDALCLLQAERGGHFTNDFIAGYVRALTWVINRPVVMIHEPGQQGATDAPPSEEEPPASGSPYAEPLDEGRQQ